MKNQMLDNKARVVLNDVTDLQEEDGRSASSGHDVDPSVWNQA